MDGTVIDEHGSDCGSYSNGDNHSHNRDNSN